MSASVEYCLLFGEVCLPSVAWAAWASALGTVLAVIIALALALLAPHYAGFIEKRRIARAGQKELRSFIDRFSAALHRIWVQSKFSPVHLDEAGGAEVGLTAVQLRSAGMLDTEDRSCLKHVREKWQLFGEALADEVLRTVDTVLEHEKKCAHFADRLEQSGGNLGFQVFALNEYREAKPKLERAIENLGPRLEAFGASYRSWQHDPSAESDSVRKRSSHWQDAVNR